MNWEQISELMYRAKVPGGWVLREETKAFHLSNNHSKGGFGPDYRVSLCFIPDPKGEWVLPKYERPNLNW